MSCAGLVCDDCAACYAPDERLLSCPACGGLLDPRVDIDRIRRAKIDTILARPANVWRWSEFLPVNNGACRVNLGAGGSPLIESPRLSEWIGAGRVWVKYEGAQPTHSLKDRSFAIAISRALELGFHAGLTYSSGNAAASFAAHANRAGMRAIVVVDAVADPAKLAMIRGYGCPVFLLDWDDFSEVDEMMRRVSRLPGVLNFVIFQNPWRHDGYKTYAFENWLDLGRRVPDHELHPVGTGGGIFGSWKGYRDLLEIGWSDRLPCLHGVQPAACASVATAFRNGSAAASAEGDPRATIAQAIASNIPIDRGRRPLRAVRSTGGSILSVSDEEIREAIHRLGREGIFAEPAGASTLAAAKHLARAGRIRPGEVVVCTVTASGLKQPDTPPPPPPWPRIKADFEQLQRALREASC